MSAWQGGNFCFLQISPFLMAFMEAGVHLKAIDELFGTVDRQNVDCSFLQVEIHKKWFWALLEFQCSAKEEGWFCCSHAAAWDSHPSHSIPITLQQL